MFFFLIVKFTLKEKKLQHVACNVMHLVQSGVFFVFIGLGIEELILISIIFSRAPRSLCRCLKNFFSPLDSKKDVFLPPDLSSTSISKELLRLYNQRRKLLHVFDA